MTMAAVAATAAAARALLFFLVVAVVALVFGKQSLPVGDRDLVVIRVDFAERQEPVPVAAVVDEGSLERGLYARDLGKIDVAPQLLAVRSLEVELLDPIAAQHDHPGLLRVGGVDKHFVGH